MTPHEVEILKRLDQSFTAPVTAEDLKRAVVLWSDNELDHAFYRVIVTGMNKLGKSLPKPLQIFKSPTGWTLRVADRR
ncbi:hypothetical protein [Limnoglobus roseus]|uniref:hypothetical protein n=1 Tax=Limnoglobus roseus TaxID=2598579 RepID=UPI0011EA8877|nr:hypothetical protein [Limnoglobus roseus]